MSKYSAIKKKAAGGKYMQRGGKCYADGGRVAKAAAKPAKTVVNVIVPPSAGGPAAGAAAPVAPMPSGAPAPRPVPPAAAGMAMNAMSGKPGGMFARGGRVQGGAGGGVGRLAKVAAEKKMMKK